jgi:hypothetical protein
VLNNIYKFCVSHIWTIPTAALAIGFAVIGQHSKPVLSNQYISDSQDNSATHLLSRLREVKGERNQVWTDSESNISENPQQKELTKSASRSNIKLPSSQSSARNLNTIPATTTIASAGRNLPLSNLPRKDGTYLYGQSPKPNQVGQGYIVFQKRQGQVKGAMYMPSSEFSCFQGTIDRSGELAMTVNASPYEIGFNHVATNSTTPSISDDEFTSYPYSVTLQDYHQLKSISANDQRILQICNQVSADGYQKLVN